MESESDEDENEYDEDEDDDEIESLAEDLAGDLEEDDGSGDADDEDEEEIIDEDVHKVEKLLDKRTYRRQVQYLVKWVGYDEPSWEPAKNILCPKLIEMFENRTLNPS